MTAAQMTLARPMTAREREQHADALRPIMAGHPRWARMADDDRDRYLDGLDAVPVEALRTLIDLGGALPEPREMVRRSMALDRIAKSMLKWAIWRDWQFLPPEGRAEYLRALLTLPEHVAIEVASDLVRECHALPALTDVMSLVRGKMEAPAPGPDCDLCGGSGWRHVVRIVRGDPYDFAARCTCRAQ